MRRGVIFELEALAHHKLLCDFGKSFHFSKVLFSEGTLGALLEAHL